jgi:ankyrin repeat protein
MAAVSGNTKVLETLLEEGADKDIVDRWGHTPLHVAVVSGNTMAVDLLTKNGATLAVSDPAAELCTGAAAEDISQVRPPILLADWM